MPNRIDITISNTYNAQRISNDISVHYVPKEYLQLGAIEVTTPFGNKVMSYNLERIICDLVKNENNGLNFANKNNLNVQNCTKL